MLYKNNWEETKNKWKNYWKRENTGRPLMCVIAKNEDKVDLERAAGLKSKDMDDKYLNAEKIVERFRYFCETHDFHLISFKTYTFRDYTRFWQIKKPKEQGSSG